MKRAGKMLLTVLGIMVLATSVAQADHRSSRSSYRPSYSHSSHSHSNYSHGYSNFGLSFGNVRSYGNYGGGSSCYSAPTWHDTSHYDYHPTEYRIHGNHVHVQPGHYDYHSTGHWHR